jgi:hypothetical protein
LDLAVGPRLGIRSHLVRRTMPENNGRKEKKGVVAGLLTDQIDPECRNIYLYTSIQNPPFHDSRSHSSQKSGGNPSFTVVCTRIDSRSTRLYSFCPLHVKSIEECISSLFFVHPTSDQNRHSISRGAPLQFGDFSTAYFLLSI